MRAAMRRYDGPRGRELAILALDVMQRVQTTPPVVGIEYHEPSFAACAGYRPPTDPSVLVRLSSVSGGGAMSAFLEAALRYARCRRPLFPCVAGSKKPPRGSRGLLGASTDARKIVA